MKGETKEAIGLIEKGLAISENEKQKATHRALLCFLHLKCGEAKKAASLASALPHTRESREAIEPLIARGLDSVEIDENIRKIIIGE